jgi:threonine dehydrogenase-like Zn-dependent dehydrogenase
VLAVSSRPRELCGSTRIDNLVMVMGAGPIGLFHLQLALLVGARAVIMSDPSAARWSHAKRLGGVPGAV